MSLSASLACAENNSPQPRMAAMIVFIGSFTRGRLCNRAFHSLRELHGLPAAPIVHEQHARFFTAHVMMDRNDVDPAFAQRFEDRLQFLFEHDEIPIDYGVVIIAGERSPGVYAH